LLDIVLEIKIKAIVSYKHGEPRNRVPEEGSESEEG
jgi:hypothetical protein